MSPGPALFPSSCPRYCSTGAPPATSRFLGAPHLGGSESVLAGSSPASSCRSGSLPPVHTLVAVSHCLPPHGPHRYLMFTSEQLLPQLHSVPSWRMRPPLDSRAPHPVRLPSLPSASHRASPRLHRPPRPSVPHGRRCRCWALPRPFCPHTLKTVTPLG